MCIFNTIFSQISSILYTTVRPRDVRSKQNERMPSTSAAASFARSMFVLVSFCLSPPTFISTSLGTCLVYRQLRFRVERIGRGLGWTEAITTPHFHSMRFCYLAVCCCRLWWLVFQVHIYKRGLSWHRGPFVPCGSLTIRRRTPTMLRCSEKQRDAKHGLAFHCPFRGHLKVRLLPSWSFERLCRWWAVIVFDPFEVFELDSLRGFKALFWIWRHAILRWWEKSTDKSVIKASVLRQLVTFVEKNSSGESIL